MFFRKFSIVLSAVIVSLGFGLTAHAESIDTGDAFRPKSMCPDAEPTAFQPSLRQGHYGMQVETLQGLLGIHADGCYGPATDRAVRSYQERNQLYIDGIVGRCTWNVLNGNAPTQGCISRHQAPSAPASRTYFGAGQTAVIVIDQWKEVVRLKVGNEIIDTMPMVDNHHRLAKGEYTVCGFVRSNRDVSLRWKLPNFVRLCHDGSNTGKGFHAIPVDATTGEVMHDDSYLGTGKKQSGGCVRLSLADSQILWDFAKKGMKVSVV